MSQFNNIFISHAKEDYSYAEELYNFLLSKGLDPWLDKKKLRPGQNWEFELQKGLRTADFIILLLSKTAVSKRGYVQREFRQALDFCKNKLDSDIFLIPLKIDVCDVPYDLQKFQWIEYGGDAFDRILESIEAQRSILIKENIELQTDDSKLQLIEEKVKSEIGTKSPKFIYEFTYPQYRNSNEHDHLELNTLFKHEVLKHLFEIRREYFENLKDIHVEGTEDRIDTADSEKFGEIKIAYESQYFVSYSFFVSEYLTGTPHGMYGTAGANFFKNPLRKFELNSLFNDRDNYLLKMRELVHEKLMLIAENQDDQWYDSETDKLPLTPENKKALRESFYIFEDGLQAIEENFENYYFNENSIVFIYNPYHLTAWAQGSHFPEILFEELLEAFPNETKLHHFLAQFQNS